MESIALGVRGNSTNARYSGGFPDGTKLNEAYVTSVVDAGYLSGSYIDLSDTTKVKALIFNGRKNTSSTRSMSNLLRFAPTYTGSPAVRRMLWAYSTGLGNATAYLELFHDTNGNLYLIGKNETGVATAATISLGAWSPTSGTIYDFAFLWDGTTTANAMKLYIDNTLLGAGGTSTNAMLSTWDNTYWKAVSLGCGQSGTTSAMKVDEFFNFNGAINPASVALVGGSGALNGASRTALIDCPVYDGSKVTTAWSSIK